MGRPVTFISNYRLTQVQNQHGPVWLFLPGGAGLGSEYYESLMDEIQIPGSIYLLDYPGDGSNPKPLEPKLWKKGLIDVVRSFEDVHLVAHSFGAMFVMTIPELEDELQALILMDGSPKKLLHHHPGPSHLKQEFPQALPHYVTKEQLSRAEKLFANLPYNDEAFIWVRDHFHPDFHPSFIPTKVPTLLLTGSLDEISPFDNYTGTPYLNRSNILPHVIEGASHFPWLEKPEEVNRWLNVMCEAVLTTERLILRRLQPTDLPEVAELLADPLVMKSSLKGPLSLDEAKEYLNDRMIAHYQKWGIGPWGLFTKNDAQFLGIAGLLMQEIDGQKQVEIAYRLLPRYWKKGYAIEAASAVRDWGLEHLGISHLISIIEPSNEASIRVAERMGMVKVKDAVFHGFDVGVYRVRPIKLHPFDESWHAIYQQEERQLKEAVDGFPIQFFHIGSTSIPGCAAKPIIDILGVVPDVFAVDDVAKRMTDLGYDALGEFGMPHRRYFTKYALEGMPVHLHIFEDTDPEVGRHLRFRDYLTAHQELLDEYCAIKEKQAMDHPLSSDLYTMGKSAFIERIDRQAALEGKYGIQWKQSERRVEWTRDQLVKAFTMNWRLFHLFHVKYREDMHWVFAPDISVIERETGTLALGADFQHLQRIEAVIAEYSPLDWWIGELDRPKELEAKLTSRGFKEQEFLTVLVKDFSLSKPQIIDGELFDLDSPFDGDAPLIEISKEGKRVGTLLLHANIVGIYDAEKGNPYRKELIAFCESNAIAKGFHAAFCFAEQSEIESLQKWGYKQLTVIKRYHG